MPHRFWCLVYLTHPVIFFLGMKGYLGKTAGKSAKNLESTPGKTAVLLIISTAAYTIATYWIAKKIGYLK